MTPIMTYFSGEKFQCSIGIALACISIGLALYFFLYVKTDFLKGVGYPFLVFSLLLLIICIGVVLRTPHDIERVEHFVSQQPESIRTVEIPRMEKVMRNFTIIQIVEVSLFLVGILFFFLSSRGSIWKGVWLGLSIQALLMLGFDHFAESRGKIYLEFLKVL